MATFATSKARDYKAAVEALNTLQSNFAIVDAIRKSGRGMNKNAIPEMMDWCRRTGYEPSDFDSLDAIHIAGTKGKGSTSAFVSSILCQYRQSASSSTNGETSATSNQHATNISQIGLYTSPHLRSVTERISTNGQPISESQFARYFWSVWDRLEASAERHGPQDIPPSPDVPALPELESQTKPAKPVYFRYLTLMALHACKDLGIRPCIFECGIGGEYDSTNILVSPAISAVTSLGIDHTAVLGETIEEIAWHKSGIFKSGSKTKEVYTVDSQPPKAMGVLRNRATEKGLNLIPVPRHSAIETGTTKSGQKLTLGLSADFQKTNASLAVAIASAYLRHASITTSPSGVPIPEPSNPHSELPPEFVRGLETVQWGGRCEVRRQGNVKWCLDGGHTVDSLRLAGEWFGGVMNETTSDASGHGKNPKRQKRILLFNQQTRDANGLARTLYTALRETLPSQLRNSSARSGGEPLFDHAIFSTNITFSATGGAGAKEGQKGSYKPDLTSINTSTPDVERLTVQKGLAGMWGELDGGCAVEVEGTVEGAVRRVRALEREMVGTRGEGEDDVEVLVLVTGSLHLVGGVLEVLDVL